MTVKNEIEALLKTQLNVRVINDDLYPTMGQRGQWSHLVVPLSQKWIESKPEESLVILRDQLTKILSEFDSDAGISTSLYDLVKTLSS